MNLDIFNITHNHVEPAVGKVLLSVPFINDTYFSRSVILLTLHDSEGSVGYILNKRIPMLLHELVDDIPRSKFTVCIGGPVANDTLQMLHSLGHMIPDSIQIKPGLFWGGNFDAVRSLIKKQLIHPHEIRFFMGYSGWGKLQLHDEIQANSWVVTDIGVDTILTHNEEKLWNATLVKMGSKYKAWADFPRDPSLN
jgi:putative transcriptional regulator